jgi:pimeloyl-ACP methyl ester carboxylesterase
VVVDGTIRSVGRARRAFGGAVVLAALTTACGLEDGSHIGVATSTTTAPAPPEPVPKGPQDPVGYVEDECPFADPGVDVTCGTLTVPRDRERPDEGTIDVAVARLHATGEAREDPILYFEGGPGGASLVYADWWADHRLLGDRDIILFDQRGTGYSEPNLACDPEYEKSGETISAMSACYDRLDDVTDLADFTTRAAAQDVVDLMEAMDLRDVDFVGVSYGTRLAMVTADLAPERVRSVVLDSVYPPGVEALELQAPNAMGAFEALFDACAADDECDEAFPDVGDSLHDAIRELDANPVEIETTDDLTGDSMTYEVVGSDLVDALFTALYDRTLVGDIPRAIELAGSGDVDEVQEAFDLLGSTFSAPASPRGDDPDDDEPSTDSDGLYYSVTCSEEMPITTLDDVLAAAEGIDDVLESGLTSSAEYDISVCKVWDAGQDTAPPLEPVESDLPALLLAGSLDPITPPHWAREAAEGFPNGFVYELGGVGHGVMDSHLCGMELVLDFLDAPTETPDDDCVDGAHAPPFSVD